MASIFSKIVDGSIPCYKVYEDDDCLAFLDINPNSFGHTLCILKREVDYLFDLNDVEYNKLMNFSKKVANGLEKSVTCKRVALSVVGLEVPHVHVHLIPLNSMSDMDFSKNIQLEKKDFENLALKINSNIK
ncbi:MAG: HIT family protein [Flavobacteriaceae bacterium]|nr:HIT family protein [Flavobacteriaceae bacterium]RZP10596.1 MAG: HIT family protein [Flavobacteriales bacterium]